MTPPIAALLSALFLLPALAGQAVPVRGAATDLQPFSARYQVIKDGKPIGESHFRLQRADGNWRYTSVTEGTRGLASLLGARAEETTRFRLRGGGIELLQHEHLVHAAFYDRSRRIAVDWNAGSVRVEDSRDGDAEYSAVPGLLDKHLLSLALGRHLDPAKQLLQLPVAVHDRVQVEHFRIAGRSLVKVPAGSFQATRVDRIDKHAMSAWYAEGIPVPVKLAQSGDDKLTLLLTRFARAPR